MWTSGKIQQYPVCRPRRPQPRRLCGQRGSCQPVHCLATLAVGFSALSLLRIGMGVASPLLQQHSSVLPVMNQAVPSAAVPAAGQPKWRHTHGRAAHLVCARARCAESVHTITLTLDVALHLPNTHPIKVGQLNMWATDADAAPINFASRR